MTTLSMLVTENTEIAEINMHGNSPQRPGMRGNHTRSWSGNKQNVFQVPENIDVAGFSGFLFFTCCKMATSNAFCIYRLLGQ